MRDGRHVATQPIQRSRILETCGLQRHNQRHVSELPMLLFHGAPQPWWTAPAVSKSDCKEFGDSLLPEMDWIGFAKRDAEVRAFFDHQLGLNLAQYSMQEINISSSRLTSEELHLSIARHTLRVRKLSLNCLFGGRNIN